MAYFFDYHEDGRRDTESTDLQADYSSAKRNIETFKIRLHEEVLRSQRRKYSLALMRIAVSSTEKENPDMSALLRSSIREYDVLCALRGDEFLIAFPETEERNAEQIAHRIRQTVEQQEWAAAVDAALTANIGMACFPQDGTNAEDLMESAERELRISQRLHR